MIRLVRTMLGARRGAALTVFLLSVVATAAAAAGPLYRGPAEASARTSALALAPPGERVISRTWIFSASEPGPLDVEDRAEPPSRPGFDTVRGLRVEGRLSPTDGTALQARTSVCANLTIVDGRCLSGLRETVLTTEAAARRGLRVGSVVTFEATRLNRQGAVEAAGPPVPLSVVGVVQPPAPSLPYWAGRYPANPDILLVTAETIRLTLGPVVVGSSDLVARPEAYADPAALRAVVAAEATSATRGDYTMTTFIPALLDRLDADRRVLADNLTVAAVPLVVMAWYVLYLAVTAGVTRRRKEFALTGLRGVPAGPRFLLGGAEYIGPVLAGAPVGYLAALVALDRIAGGARPGWTSVAYAAVAAGGALAAGLLAQRRMAAQPVATLLRQAPARRAAVTGNVAIVAAVVLAAAAVYQHRAGGVGGLALLVPVLVALAAGLVGARLIAALVGLAGRRAMRRGRAARALRQLVLARQPGQVRLAGFLIAMLGVVGFVGTGRDAADQAQVHRTRAELGTAAEVAVAPVPLAQLIAAVRNADPEGRWAAAVARLTGPEGVPLLAVDTERLARVSSWDGDRPADQVARLLRPAEPPAWTVRGAGFDVRITTGPARDSSVFLVVRLVTRSGRSVEARVGPMRTGPATYRADAPACVDGCRIASLVVDPRGPGFDLDLTVHGIGDVASAELTRPPWRAEAAAEGGPAVRAEPGAEGLRLVYTGAIRPETLVAPMLVGEAIPVLPTAGTTVRSRPDDDLRLAVEPAGPAVLPGLGTRGAMVDAEYLDLATVRPIIADRGSVWLAADAPAGAADRLRAAGLDVVTTTSFASVLDRRRESGPALAIRFYLALMLAAVGVGMGAVAVVAGAENPGLAGQLRSLRMQGLRRATAGRVAFGGYATVVLLAAGLAGLAVVAAWWLAGDVITPFADGGAATYRVGARPAVTVGALAAAAGALLVVAALAAWSLFRTVEKGLHR